MIVTGGGKSKRVPTRWPGVAKPAKSARASAPRAPAAGAPADSLVLQVPAAEPEEAETHFLTQLSFETDSSDVQADLGRGITAFVVVDCRASEQYAKGHVPGALNLPYRSITARSAEALPKDTTYVVYDAGLVDNAATKTCLRLSALGLRVKEMVGGLHGWRDEGYPVETGSTPKKRAPLQRV